MDTTRKRSASVDPDPLDAGAGGGAGTRTTKKKTKTATTTKKKEPKAKTKATAKPKVTQSLAKSKAVDSAGEADKPAAAGGGSSRSSGGKGGTLVSYMHDRDTRLMLEFQAGDESAFTALFNTHSAPVLGTLMRYCRDRQIAEDLTQEAFLRVYRARERYEPRAKFTTWLYRIVTNLAFNWSRDAPKRRHRPLAAIATASSDSLTIPEAADPSAVDPDAGLEQEELARVVVEALEELPETQRIALILNKYQDQSYQEIAAALETTEKAVKSLLARARDNLREKLEPWFNRLDRED